MEARTGIGPALMMDMDRGKFVLIGLCAAVVVLGPLAATTIGADSQPAAMQPLRLAQPAQLSAPRAVQVGGVAVGDRLDSARLHVITRPGLYGLNGNAPGDRFGILDGMLVRFDPDDMRLKSIIRTNVRPVD